MTTKKNITPEYTRKAIEKYNAKFDRIAVNLPKGTAEKIRNATGESVNGYINGLVRDDLTRRGLLDAGADNDATDAGGAVSECPF